MSAHDPPPPEPTPFDRLGSFLGDLGSVTANISARNAQLWMTSTTNAAAGGSYRPDREIARWTEIATANAQDLAALWLGMSPRQVLAYPITTAFVQFTSRIDVRGKASWLLTDQVVIPSACGAVEKLPDHACIHISGPDPAGVAALQRALRARIGDMRLSYLLESYDVRDLRPGTYQGIVYLDGDTKRPLANLVIVVDGPPLHADADADE